MRVLYVGSKVPFPVLDGGCFAMMRFIESLKETDWSLDALFFTTQKHPYIKESNYHLDSFFHSINTVAINTEVKPLAAVWNYILHKNYNLKRFKTEEVYTVLNQYLSTSYDLVIFDSLFAAAFLPQLKEKYQTTFIVRAHNVEHEIWRTLANEEKSKLKKKYLIALSKTLQQEEFTILNAADQIWTMSEEDSDLLKKKAISTPIKYIPVAIEVAKIKTDLTQTNCFHIGSMNWQPNIEAVNYLIDQLWLKNSNLPELTIAGSHSESINSQRFPKNVSIAGRVPDVNAFMSNAGILVSPIQSGSGIRIKLLEALALGVPCITTKLGAAGINTEEAGVLLAETPIEWEKQIQLLSSSFKLREENSQKSIAYILNKHSFANCKLLIETALEG